MCCADVQGLLLLWLSTFNSWVKIAFLRMILGNFIQVWKNAVGIHIQMCCNEQQELVSWSKNRKYKIQEHEHLFIMTWYVDDSGIVCQLASETHSLPDENFSTMGAMLKSLAVNDHMMLLMICRRDVLDHKQKGCFKRMVLTLK